MICGGCGRPVGCLKRKTIATVATVDAQKTISQGKAAALEGFDFVGIELSAEYLEIARRRIEHAQMQPPLDGLA